MDIRVTKDSKRKEKSSCRKTLTIRCRMWRSQIEISTADLCFARTRMGQEHRSFVWAIKEFHKLQPEQKNSIVLQTETKGGPSPLFTFYLNGDEVNIEIRDDDPKADFFIVCEISVINAYGEKTYSDTFETVVRACFDGIPEISKIPKEEHADGKERALFTE
ncbi:speckle-type POZ protein [Trichonephila clavata]|uniref:Speckle-type POZ protein n=1 Tax=Trichonephila clavata TaxID=2740835 RepID=A0A8X6GJI6_TRICU|nr:speckle-type POZ protein [Trichonephila clavata]